MKSKQGGFTLVELVVVIVILGILAATALPRFIDMSGEAEEAAAQGVAGAIASATSLNYAAKKASATGAVAINDNPVCVSTVMDKVLQGGFPSGFSISGSGRCDTGESATCTVTKGAKTVSATVICAR